MNRPRADAMVVVVPVRNEELLLSASLSALAAAVDRATAAGIATAVRVVLDRCTDASADIAARFPFRTLTTAAGRVGAARALGVADALDALAGVPLERIWIANTDADSRVPAGWLSNFHDCSPIADICVGTVRPDFADLSISQRALWLRTHTRGRPNGHVHGANLGISALTYLDAGGFAPLGEHEDVDLVARCRNRGAVIVASDDAEVVTSGRFTGRTPGGYAGYLRQQAADLARDASE
ncbi:glycosyltransferase [Microbacterium atlanticum]|uniref:glycosyltransferase n=1 Tax=Microbacterium atlanticum TaxID=2782168 RepID=UPI001E50FC5E|nr:glycosyl transferase [Microbacterium atlanticum]